MAIGRLYELEFLRHPIRQYLAGAVPAELRHLLSSCRRVHPALYGLYRRVNGVGHSDHMDHRRQFSETIDQRSIARATRVGDQYASLLLFRRPGSTTVEGIIVEP